jgi:hypothetical protein
MDGKISTGLNMKTKSKLYVVIINILVFCILWCILELICHTIYRNTPPKFNNGKWIVETNLGHKFDNTKQSIISHPYLLYVNNPNYFDSVLQHNSLGYRSSEFKIVKDSNTFRILALGGSTTYGYLNKDPNKTWPAILQKKLQAITTKKVEVINAGLNYATSAELLAAYIFRHRFLSPDLIIFHEGGNDVFPEIFPNYNPEYTHFRSHGNGTKLRKGERFLLYSNVFKLFYTFWLNSTGTVYSPQPFDYEQLNKSEVKERIANDSNYIGFKRNVDLLITLARLEGSKILLMSFLNAPRDRIYETRSELRNIVDEYIYATNKNNEIMRNLCSLNKVNFIQLDPGLFKTEWFIDNCHLYEPGEETKAQILFDQLKGLFNN